MSDEEKQDCLQRRIGRFISQLELERSIAWNKAVSSAADHRYDIASLASFEAELRGKIVNDLKVVCDSSSDGLGRTRLSVLSLRKEAEDGMAKASREGDHSMVRYWEGFLIAIGQVNKILAPKK